MTSGSFGIGFTWLQIRNPDNTLLTQASPSLGSFFIEPITLQQAGTYTIVIDPLTFNTGAINLNLYTVVDLTGTVTIGGPVVPLALSTPGQQAIYTMPGTQGQLATVRINNNFMSGTWVGLFRPDWTLMTSKSQGNSSFSLTTQTLPVTGNYFVVVNPFGAQTGNPNIWVTSP